MKKNTVITLAALALMAGGVTFGGIKIKEKKEKDKIEKTLNAVLIPNVEKELNVLLKQDKDLQDSLLFYDDILNKLNSQTALSYTANKPNDSVAMSQLSELEDLLKMIKKDVNIKFFKKFNSVEERYRLNRELGFIGAPLKESKALWYLSDGIISGLQDTSFAIPCKYTEKAIGRYGDEWEKNDCIYFGNILSEQGFEEWFKAEQYHANRFVFDDIMNELILAVRSSRIAFTIEDPYQGRTIDVFVRQYQKMGSYKDILSLLNVVWLFLNNIDNSENIINQKTLEESKNVTKELLKYVEKQVELEQKRDSISGRLDEFRTAQKELTNRINHKRQELKQYKNPDIVNRMYREQRKK